MSGTTAEPKDKSRWYQYSLWHVFVLVAMVLQVAGGRFAVAVGLAQDAAREETGRPLMLWYTRPASTWTEALTIGNGRLGAMVFGGVQREHLQLNEDTLWSGGPHCYDNPDAHGHLGAVRKALEQGEFVRTQETAQKMLGRPKYQQAYLPLSDLFLDFPKEGKASEYRRALNVRDGVAEVTYRIDDARFTRRVFASCPDQAIVIRLECDKPKGITFDLSMTSPHPCKSGAISDDMLSMTRHVGPRQENRLIGPWKGKGLRFGACVRVAAEGGKVVTQDGKVSVKGADAATIVYAAGTSYVSHSNIDGDPVAKVKKYLAAVKGRSYERLYKTHVDDHARLFGRVSLDLGGQRAAKTPTDERLKRAAEGAADPLLAAQLFQYGRYLMIAGSRPGTQPLNLHGIWNDKVRPPWGSKYTININIQMNYWIAEVCNLSECHEPLLRMVRELRKPGARTAIQAVHRRQ